MKTKEKYLPIIDISILSPLSGSSDLLHESIATSISNDLRTALSKYGFLYITGHGIEKDLIQESFIYSKRFFSECHDLHIRYRRRKSQLLGYIDGKNEKDFPDRPNDIKQAYDFVAGSIEFNEMPLDMQMIMEQLQEAFPRLSKFLLHLLALSTGKNEDYFLKGHQHIGNITKNTSTLRILHYPAPREKPDPMQARISEHTDFGSFTMLLQDDYGGLQVNLDPLFSI